MDNGLGTYLPSRQQPAQEQLTSELLAPERLVPFERAPADHRGPRAGTEPGREKARAGARPRKRDGRSRRSPSRLISLLCAAVIVVVIGVTNVGPTAPSVTASVKTFLLDWEEQSYAAAAAMTTGQPAVVERSLRAVYRQLGAQDLDLGMGPISVQGNKARASFFASFDLGRGGLSWSYRGNFTLRRSGSAWLVVWSPSVIVPGLGRGDRLAVLTTLPNRALLLDQQGRSLIQPSPAIEVGVIPDKVVNPLLTAEKLAKVTDLAPSDAYEMSGQIQAWSPKSFLELVQLTPSTYQRLRGALSKIPDLRHERVIKRLFDSAVPVITGTVATETAKTLVDDGEPYRPGTTIGLSGLQQAFQQKLAGKPTTYVVVQDSAGKWVKLLYEWPGSDASNVRTTISGRVQGAARNALTGMGLSAAIVAVEAGSGQILAVATHNARGVPEVSPLGGLYQPGQSFTIVSAAALLAAKSVTAGTPVKCLQSNPVGGQPFANVPAEPNLGPQPTFAEVFAHACSTSFVGLSLNLTSRELTAAAQEFGIGVPWKLPLPAVTGSMSSPGTNAGELAADSIGTGSTAVSPLDMALVAAAVDSGTWHAPQLVSTPAQQPARPRISPEVIRQLRNLMWTAVKSGAARSADQPGIPLFGQVGSAPLAGHHHGLRAIWFVGYRGKVAFAVLVFARSAAFTPAVQIANQFAAGLPG
jgi:cell division protein FtsI/penicillin-binding protein 2